MNVNDTMMLFRPVGPKELELIRASGNSGVAKPMHWRVQRGLEPLDVTVTPSVVVENELRVGRIEVYPGQPPEMITVRYGVFDGLKKAVSQTWEMSALTLKMLGKMVIGQASLKNLSGPLTIADYAGQSAKLGIAYYLGFLAVVSVSPVSKLRSKTVCTSPLPKLVWPTTSARSWSWRAPVTTSEADAVPSSMSTTSGIASGLSFFDV